VKTFGGMLSKEQGCALGPLQRRREDLVLGAALFPVGDLVVTGLILDSEFRPDPPVMQQANLVHLISALLGITVAFFHIYLARSAARRVSGDATGYVDEAVAKSIHSHWYADVKAGRSPQAFADDVPAETRSKVLEAIRESK